MYELMGWQRPTGEIFAPIPSSNYHTELPRSKCWRLSVTLVFWNYYLNTGDLKPLEIYIPKYKKYLDIWQKNNDGTITFRAGEWTWGDWGKKY